MLATSGTMHARRIQGGILADGASWLLQTPTSYLTSRETLSFQRRPC